MKIKEMKAKAKEQIESELLYFERMKEIEQKEREYDIIYYLTDLCYEVGLLSWYERAEYIQQAQEIRDTTIGFE